MVLHAFATNFYESTVYFGKSYSMLQAFPYRILLTMFFELLFLGATDKFANGKFARYNIGLGFTFNSPYLNSYY